MKNFINLGLYPWRKRLFIYIQYFSLPPLLSALFFLAVDTQSSTIVIQDLFEEISSGMESSRAVAGELLQIMTCNLVNTLKHKDPNVE